ncbi:WD repeat-containing protein 13-like isoform X2 [Chrysoperla carnea]|uniref:WD repeat-containing protein 13-like isoform X2 n=1 Tax=Chrysoperla carnea TaxID=189513 RepID=UPI001D099800|nr:WD repeat-containing protein 13-like isoform X2 [Chrysoperla carnea]
MAVAWQQQIFALDARYNAHRAPNHANFRTLYIRRRSQLLRENRNLSPEHLKSYLKIRGQLLQKRYGSPLDQPSIGHSRSMSLRSVSGDFGDARLNIQNTGTVSGLVPTKQADASRAIVGGNSIAENYAFTGVHHIFDQHKSSVVMVKFANNDRSRLLCASSDGTLSICEVAVEKPYLAAVLRGHTQPVTGCDWSASNDLVASCSQDGSVRLWDSKNGTCLRSIQDKLLCPLQCCLFQPTNCNLVITGNNKGELRIINVSTGRAPLGGYCRVGGSVLSIGCDINGQLWWVGTNKGEIISITCDITGRLRKVRKFQIAGNNCLITSISWRAWISREARDPSLLVNCSNNKLALFRVMDKEGNLQLKWSFNNKQSDNNMIRSTFCPIMSFRQGACVVTGSDDGQVYFVDIERPPNRAIVTVLQGHANASFGLSFNYDESLLATSDKEGLVIIWRRAS